MKNIINIILLLLFIAIMITGISISFTAFVIGTFIGSIIMDFYYHKKINYRKGRLLDYMEYVRKFFKFK